MDILSLFSCFETLLAAATRRQLVIISNAVLTMTGRMTMTGISRWTVKGGSYRTIQRFFATALPCSELFVKFFQTQIYSPMPEYILAGDATTVTKAGKQTHGIDRFFSGVVGKVVRGLEFFVFSVVDEGEQNGRGQNRKYRANLDYENLPRTYLKKSEQKKDLMTKYYHGIFLHQ